MIEGNDFAQAYILGDSFHRSYLATYDLDYKYVGFVPHIYSNSTITPSKITRKVFNTAIAVGVILILAILWGTYKIFKEYSTRRARMEQQKSY